MTIVVFSKKQFLQQLTYGKLNRGDRIVYHQGFLMWDRDMDNVQIEDKARAQIDALARTVYKAYQEGKVYLLQKRIDKRYGCEYYAVKA
jgi:hypothetical protein